MGLYDRVIGRDDQGRGVDGKIPVHVFNAVFAEYARSQMTGGQAQAAVEAASGAPLTSAEALEAQALLTTVTGSATARLARAKVIEDVLILGEHNTPGYQTPTQVRTRLGV